MRNVVWKLFEDPNSSKAARVCLLIQTIRVEEFGKKQHFFVQVLVKVSSLFLVASIVMLILSTVPEFQVRRTFIEMGIMKQFRSFIYLKKIFPTFRFKNENHLKLLGMNISDYFRN